MHDRYAYSLDHVRFEGEYFTREEAADAGLERALQQPVPPAEVYVGRREALQVPANGHARLLVESMRRRMRHDSSAEDARPLEQVTTPQLADLDERLAAVVREWLRETGGGQSTERVKAISEHAVEPVRQTRAA